MAELLSTRVKQFVNSLKSLQQGIAAV